MTDFAFVYRGRPIGDPPPCDQPFTALTALPRWDARALHGLDSATA